MRSGAVAVMLLLWGGDVACPEAIWEISDYDMFEGNTEDPNLFVDYLTVKYPALKTHVCDYGRRVVAEAASG